MMHITISTHQGVVYDDDIDYCVVKSQDSHFAIMHNHVPIVSIIQTGYVKIVYQSKEFFIAISNGVLEHKNNMINCLAQEAFIGETAEEANKHLLEIREERLQKNKKESTNTTQIEKELREHIKKTGAGSL